MVAEATVTAAADLMPAAQRRLPVAAMAMAAVTAEAAERLRSWAAAAVMAVAADDPNR